MHSIHCPFRFSSSLAVASGRRDLLVSCAVSVNERRIAPVLIKLGAESSLHGPLAPLLYSYPLLRAFASYRRHVFRRGMYNEVASVSASGVRDHMTLSCAQTKPIICRNCEKRHQRCIQILLSCIQGQLSQNSICVVFELCSCLQHFIRFSKIYDKGK